jgi:aldose 1-epimerase
MSTDPVTLTVGDLEATVLPGLGMVISSLRHQGEELLAQRGGVEAYAEKGSTFAIPLLYPWANRLRGWEYSFAGRQVELRPDQPALHIDGDTGYPSHGVLAASPYWQVVRSSEAELIAELDFGAVPEYMAAFPFAHTLRFSAALAIAALTITLTVTPTGELPVPISFGFHPYLTLPGVDRSEWEIAAPVAGGALNGRLGDRAFDDPFTELAGQPSRFTLTGGGRELSVRFLENYDVTQIYSPAGAQFICFEPMTAPVDALRTGQGLRSVAPGESFTAQFEITVR